MTDQKGGETRISDERQWQPIETAPENVPLMTKIDDGHARNEQPLLRDGNLWWFTDRSMYVYYRPTHWMPLPTAPKVGEGTP